MAHELLPNPLLNMIGMFGVIIVFLLIYKFMPNPSKKRQAIFSDLDPEVVIVGGGVTGASFAAALGKRGRRVVVIERDMSKPNTIRGEGLLPGGIQALEDMGLKDVLEIYQYMPSDGLFLVDHETEVKTLVTFPSQGRTSRHGNLVQALRKMAKSQSTVRFIEGIGTDLLKENERVTGVKYRLRGSQDLKVIRAPLTVVSDGYYSNLRGQFPDVKKQITESYVLGFELKNVQHLHETFPEIRCGLPFAQYVLYKLDEETSRVLLVFHDNPSAKTESFLETKVAPSLPEHIQKPLLEALKHSTSNSKCIAGKQTAATYDHIPGVLLLGDALSTRDPIVASGMTAALRDVRFWLETLSEIPDLADDETVLKQKELFKKKRKQYSWCIDMISHVLATVASESEGSSVRLRQAMFRNFRALEKDVPPETKQDVYSMFALLNTDSRLLKKFLLKTCVDAVLQCIQSNSWTSPLATVTEIFGIVYKFWKIVSIDL